jgi:glucosamine 6-phosphate synthetase-like amidotransferase/phosphosugar isomerase protein
MCGQCGLILADNCRRRQDKLRHLRYIFLRLLALNEFRGKHASGVALIDNDGGYRLLKRPIEASKFVCMPEFRDVLLDLSNKTSLLLGHARFATVGSVEKMSNGHPIKSGCCLATANGTIFNADALFKKFRLTRFAEVDSEFIARLADKHAPDGEIKVKNFVHSLRHCRGQISAVVASLFDPQRVVILKGNKPLSLRYNPKLRAVIYSSDAFHLDVVLKGDGDWKKLDLPSMTCSVFDTGNLPEFETMPFNFKREKRRIFSCTI